MLIGFWGLENTLCYAAIFNKGGYFQGYQLCHNAKQIINRAVCTASFLVLQVHMWLKVFHEFQASAGNEEDIKSVFVDARIILSG